MSRASLRSAVPLLSLFIWLMSALIAAGPSLSALHFALVRHRLCLEHGQLEHVDVHEGATPSVIRERPSGPALSQDGSPSDLDAHSHDACAVTPPGSLVAVFSQLATLALLAVCASAIGGSRPRRAHVGIPLLRYAPKLAPPGASC
jgi:hypothetical protein